MKKQNKIQLAKKARIENFKNQIKELYRRKEALNIEKSMIEREKERMDIALKQLEKDLESLYEEL